MAATPLPPGPLAPRELASGMTRCECAGVGFEELVRRLRLEGASVPDLCRRTGCGETCTACLPDLVAYLRCQDL